VLLAIVVGSGIMGDRLSGGNVAIALLANSLATGAGLVALILMLGGISGAHFNPVVSLVEVMRGHLTKREASFYVLAQVLGALAGVAVAHLMFGEALFSLSTHERSGPGQWLSEFVATFGLIAVIRGVGRDHKSEVPYAVGLYILAAYWFTSSTSFANPAVTLARALTPTFAGIRPTDVLGFWVVQVSGALSAEALFRWLENRRLGER
jgi:glycerol uptake facilitator-like aquaporin